jgi:hypothetical protein
MDKKKIRDESHTNFVLTHTYANKSIDLGFLMMMSEI